MPKDSAPLRVLVVDDEHLLRWSLAEMLADAGCLVSQAVDCLSALRAVADTPRPFDVVLLDCHLPDSTELSALARLRHDSPSSAVVYMTAFGTPDVVRAAYELGAWRVVSKPFEMGEMQRIVFAAAPRQHE